MPKFTEDKLEQAIINRLGTLSASDLYASNRTRGVDLILLLGEHGYPPVDRDEVYKEIFEQAENFKKYRPTTL